jgi:hypothetical protein
MKIQVWYVLSCQLKNVSKILEDLGASIIRASADQESLLDHIGPEHEGSKLMQSVGSFV